LVIRLLFSFHIILRMDYTMIWQKSERFLQHFTKKKKALRIRSGGSAVLFLQNLLPPRPPCAYLLVTGWCGGQPEK